jgi:hypothetical protein
MWREGDSNVFALVHLVGTEVGFYPNLHARVSTAQLLPRFTPRSCQVGHNSDSQVPTTHSTAQPSPPQRTRDRTPYKQTGSPFSHCQVSLLAYSLLSCRCEQSCSHPALWQFCLSHFQKNPVVLFVFQEPILFQIGERYQAPLGVDKQSFLEQFF